MSNKLKEIEFDNMNKENYDELNHSTEFDNEP